MKLINCTTTCGCGNWKPPGRQFCNVCWSALPLDTQKRFNAAAEAFLTITKQCAAALRHRTDKPKSGK